MFTKVEKLIYEEEFMEWLSSYGSYEMVEAIHNKAKKSFTPGMTTKERTLLVMNTRVPSMEKKLWDKFFKFKQNKEIK